MKHGYSLLLGEYIDAKHIEYHDCKAFQIVCPACYEPVFKVERGSEDSAVEYLSHYPETKSEPEACELRVKKISIAEKNGHNTKARSQRLEYFLSVLRQMIGKHSMYQKGYEKSQTQLNRSKALKWFRDVAHEHQQEQKFGKPEFYAFAEEYVADIIEMGGVIKTAFSLSVQKRIAFDIWNYLMSIKGRDNYNFLFNHAYLVVMSRLQQSNDQRGWSIDEEFLASCMAKLVTTSKNRGMMILSEMGNTPIGPPFAIEGSNFFNKAVSEIMHEMVGTLLALPYFEWLKNIERSEAH
ncbi:hypothetical protein [Thiocystis violascens]|uniref:Uncharacterized protein n=1 Tax=Thiocystis violascens (strain ATCC 17096 / DSM 198 / 6111) TaxID=765911 RepID=I3Y9J4_THIV6|nr:hypothetical protein [Thiocystis violascens]AFL73662.1 hypothetical protein Thivi_1688 [Thiocystis violascens DSM 198]